MLLLAAFATIALVLALVGIYGVMSYTVGLRMHEMAYGSRSAAGRETSRQCSSATECD